MTSRSAAQNRHARVPRFFGLAALMMMMILAAGTAGAQGPATNGPAGYRVTGVAPDDMLNVRDRAGVPGSAVIGRLAPDARNVVRTGDVQDVGGRDWWHIRHSALPPQGGWVNSRFLEAQEDGLAALADPARADQPPAFTDAQGHDAMDAEAVQERLIASMPQTGSVFLPGSQLNPLTKALLMLENEEGVADHARFRIRYGMETRVLQEGRPPIPHSFVQVDRFNLGEVFREAVAESFGEARTPPAETFGAGEHVSYRFEFRPIQGTTADPVAIARRAISDAEAQDMDCLTLPCLDPGSVGEGASAWHDHAGDDTSFDRPYEDIRNGVYTPATLMDLLALETGAARLHDGRLTWSGFEESESVQPGEPFMEIIMDVNLAQDYGIESVLRRGQLMDDSVAAIWKRAITFPGGGDAPMLMLQRAYECARGQPGPEGLCP